MQNMYICSTIMCDFISQFWEKITHQKMRMSNPSQGESRGVAIDPFLKRCDLQGEGPKG